jgi:hypothetical protein
VTSQQGGPEQDWEATPPYAGPPSYPPQPYQYQQFQPYPPQAYSSPPGWGAPSYGPPPWGWTPAQPPRPQRPGTSIAAAVLAFTLALLTLVGSVYAAAFSALLALARRPDGGLDSWTPFAQLLVVIALVAGGVLVLGGRRTVLLAAAAAELLLAVWWFAVLGDVAPAGLSGQAVLLPLVFGLLAAVAVGLTCTPSARAWARQEEGRRAAPRPDAVPGEQGPAGR